MAISILATVIRHSFGGWAVRPVLRICGSQESTNASGDRWPHLPVCPVFRYNEGMLVIYLWRMIRAIRISELLNKLSGLSVPLIEHPLESIRYLVRV